MCIRDSSRTPNGMGYRQVAMVLRAEQGLSISGKAALKLMREEGLRCRIRRRRYDSYRGEQGKVAKNVLNRDFTTREMCIRDRLSPVTSAFAPSLRAIRSAILIMRRR